MDRLLHSKQMGAGNAGTRSADIYRLAQFDKISPGSIRRPDKHGYLDANPSRAPSSRGIHTGFLTNLLVHAKIHSVSTGELVQESRLSASVTEVQFVQGECLQLVEEWIGERNRSRSQLLVPMSGGVPKMCKRTDLPLTVSKRVCKDESLRNGKKFTTPQRISPDEQYSD